MFVVISIMFGAMVIGYALRNRKFIQKTHKLVTPTIALLLLLLGVGVGSNQIILDNLSSLGAQALILATLGVLGSAIAALLVYNLFFKSKNQSTNNQENER